MGVLFDSLLEEKDPKEVFDENKKKVCVKCGAKRIILIEEGPKCGYPI